MYVINTHEELSNHEKEFLYISQEKYMKKTVFYLRWLFWHSDNVIVVLEPQKYWYAVTNNKKSIRVIGIAVHNELRNTGIASAIISRLKEEAIESQKKITCRADPTGKQFFFWLSQGFEVVRNNNDDVELEWKQ